MTEQQIADLYKVHKDTIRTINTGKSWYEDDIIYPIRITPQAIGKQKKYCIICGEELKSKATLCLKCAALKRRKVNDRPNKEELFNLLKENNGNFTKVGKLFEVTDNTVRKWCDQYEISRHSTDYKPLKKEKQKPSLPIKVQQIDKETGEIINEFISLKEAEQKTGIYHIRQASDPNNTTRKTAGGYIWKRV